jgi:hypothetical protein
MAFGGVAKTVATTPTLLGQPTNVIYIANTDAAAIFVGGSNVTTTTGVSVAATTGTLQLTGANGPVYAVSAAGTSAGAVKCLIS